LSGYDCVIFDLHGLPDLLVQLLLTRFQIFDSLVQRLDFFVFLSQIRLQLTHFFLQKENLLLFELQVSTWLGLGEL